MTSTQRLPTAGLIVIANNKLLLAYSNNKNAWYLPGGKCDLKEDALTTLKREIKEELLLELHENRLRYYTHISAQAYGEPTGVIMEQDCFIYRLSECEEITPHQEIGAVRYFNLADYQKAEVQVVGVLEVFKRLTEDGLLS